MGTGGMNEIFISTPPLSHVPGMHGNGWERVGTGGNAPPTDPMWGGVGQKSKTCRRSNAPVPHAQKINHPF